MRHLLPLSIVCVVLAAALCLPTARAQDESEFEVVPLSTVPEAQPNGLRLQTYFLVRDKNTGRVIPPNNIESVKFRLSAEASPVSALLENPTASIKIALLLDESGSMAPYVANVRTAAKDAIAKAPDQAQFAIFRFSDVSSQGQIEPNLGFTPKSDSTTINTFIDQQYDSRVEAPTCLYNIALQATRYLAANTLPGERRAIILFTDGKDERLNGTPCSDRSLDDVTREAAPESSSATPIYTVGLCTDAACGKIDRAVLDRMATQTKGIGRAGTPEQLTGLFYDVMDDLKGQRLAQATVAPCEEQQATLLVKLTSLAQPIAGVVNFSNDQCYTPRASVSISEPQAITERNEYIFPVSITNASPLALQSITVQLIDPNKTTVYNETFQEAQFQVPAGESRNLSVTVPAQPMLAAGDYVIRVQGFAQDSVPFTPATIAEGGASQVLAEISFRHTLSADVQIAIKSVLPKESVQPNEAATSIDVTLDIANKNIIDPRILGFLQYEGKIFADNGNEVQSIERTAIDLTDNKPFVLNVPLSDKVRSISAPTTYKVELTLVIPPDPRRGTQEQKSYTSNQQPFTLELSKGLTVTEQVAVFFTNPFTLASLLVVILGIAGFFAYSRYRARRVIPLPFNSSTVLLQQQNAVGTAGAAGNAKARPSSPPARVPEAKAPPAIVARPEEAKTATPGSATSGSAATVLASPVPSSATVLHNETELVAAPKKPRVRITIAQTVDSNQLREETVALPCVIGRENAHVTISGDPKISRTHAEITIENGAVIIIDRGSANGTFIANTRLPKDEPTVLSGPTTIRLGPSTTIEVELRS